VVTAAVRRTIAEDNQAAQLPSRFDPSELR
jgi:hypothetical protein